MRMNSIVFGAVTAGLLLAASACDSNKGSGDKPAASAADAKGKKAFPACLTKAAKPADAGFAANHLVGIKDAFWESGQTLVVGFTGSNTAVVAPIVKQHLIDESASSWSPHINLKFDVRADPNNQPPNPDILVATSCDKCDAGACGHYSALGQFSKAKTMRDGHSMCLAQVMLEEPARQKRIVNHEFGHALGLFHEHQRQGMDWNKPAVYKFCQDSQGWDNAKCDQQILLAIENEVPAHELAGTPYDPKSIMHYGFPAEWTISGKAHDEALELSAMDKKGIAEIYPKAQEPTGPTPGGGFVALRNSAESGNWTLYIDGPDERVSEISKVLYILHPSMVPPEGEGDASQKGHPYSGQGSQTFTARAFVSYNDGSADLLKHVLDMNAGGGGKAAGGTGIAPCDTMFTNIDRCLGSKLDAAQKRAIEQDKSTITRLAKESSNRPALKQHCDEVLGKLSAAGCK